MTPREWSCWMEGYSLRLDDGWRQTRALYTLLYNINVESHNQKSGEELIPLASDVLKQERKKMSPEEKLELSNKYREMMKTGKQIKMTPAQVEQHG